jgi:hypothetical protein
MPTAMLISPRPVDEDTSVAFPKVLKVQSRTPLPAFTLVGVGVRTVSFLGIRVYSVGFYADLANPRLKVRMISSHFWLLCES